jgi:fatty-acyl-CoA synthase
MKEGVPSTGDCAYASGISEVSLLGETIGENLARTANRWPERTALVSRHQGVRWSYRELDERVNRLGTGLIGMGVEPGERIALWAPNCAEWVLVQYASARIGAILVNLNPAYRAHELSFALRQSDVAHLISAPKFKTSNYRERVDEVRDDCERLKSVVFLGDPEWTSLESCGVRALDLAERTASLSFDDPINIQYTSGTTGAPKGATLSHHNILNNGFLVGELLGYSEQDRICIPVPFYHCFGMVMGNIAATSHGACMVIPADAFDPGTTLAAVEEENCTSLYGVPTMFIAELEHPSFDDVELTSLRTGIMAGSPCPIDVMRRVISDMHMPEISICYGMTETSPVSTQTRRNDELERRVGSVGQPGPHIEIKVVSPDTGLTVRHGEAGELCTRGYSVMLGYWEDPERTAEAIDSSGWMHTGDLATMDSQGYCQVVGRIKDMVIRGGENVYPREIEEFLYERDEIREVQVVGVPDPHYGEELCAWIRLREGVPLGVEDIRDLCRDRLAHFKVPKYILFVEEFPMTVTGKVQKFRMVEQSIERLGLDA